MNGSELRRILAKKRINIGDLADKLSMTQPNLSNQFKVQDVKSGMLEKICDALGVTMEFFYSGTKYIKHDHSSLTDEAMGLGNMVCERNPSERMNMTVDSKDEEIVFLKGQVKALKEMNQMLIERSTASLNSVSYEKKHA